MTILILILSIGWPVAAFSTLQWYRADQDATEAEHHVHHLLKLQRRAHLAIQPERPRPATPNPVRWGSRPYDRLITDMGLNPLPGSPSLSLLPSTGEAAGREAHSHATKGSA